MRQSKRLQHGLVWTLLIATVLVVSRDVIFAPRDIDTHIFKTHTGHAWEYNVQRSVALARAYAEGRSGAWLKDFSHGWGYPLFHYTGALPNALGAILYLLGGDPNAVLNLLWFLGFLFSALFMFLATRPAFGPWGALLAAVAYLFAPYRLVDIFVRTNLGEFFAFSFPPLVLYGVLGNSRRATLIGALGIACIAYTHMLSTLLIGLGFISFSIPHLILMRRHKRWEFVKQCSQMILLGFGLAASFWIPAVVDLSYVQGSATLTSGYNNYQLHFVYLHQLFSTYWEYGDSAPGPEDYMSFSLGPILLAIAGVVFAASTLTLCSAVKPQEKEQDNEEFSQRSVLGLCVSAFLAMSLMTFLTLGQSSFIWKILPQMAVVQFPWRFLFPASFFLALCLGACPRVFADLLRRFPFVDASIALITTALIVVTHWDYARAGNYDFMSNENLSIQQTIAKGATTTNHSDFLPKTVTYVPHGGMLRSSDLSSNLSSDLSSDLMRFYSNYTFEPERILAGELANGWARVQLAAGASGTLILLQHWHPGWKVCIDGSCRDTEPYREHPLAPVSVAVPENTYLVEFFFGNTFAGVLGSIIFSITAAWVLCLLLTDKSRPLIMLTLFLFFSFLTNQDALGCYLSASPLPRAVQNTARSIPVNTLLLEKTPGTSWDDPGNVIFDQRGLMIDFDEYQRKPVIEVSLDGNDVYQFMFLDGRNIVGRIELQPPFSAGLALHRFRVPKQDQTFGFNRLVLRPIAGDSLYSIGHLKLLTEEECKDKVIVSAARKISPTIIPIAQLSEVKLPGSSWNDVGNVVLGEAGAFVQLEHLHHEHIIDLSVDHNDFYSFIFFNGTERIGEHILAPSSAPTGGLNNYRIRVPSKIAAAGYDKVLVLPVVGDSYYSIGHFIVRSE